MHHHELGNEMIMYSKHMGQEIDVEELDVEELDAQIGELDAQVDELIRRVGELENQLISFMESTHQFSRQTQLLIGALLQKESPETVSILLKSICTN
jgi:uncharacterized coiled-coil DUF342 family protein